MIHKPCTKKLTEQQPVDIITLMMFWLDLSKKGDVATTSQPQKMILPPEKPVKNEYIPEITSSATDIKNVNYKIGETVKLDNIFFKTDKAELLPESVKELNNLIELLNNNLNLKIEISGHTDNIGTDNYNQKLSENRAKAVVDFLVQHGIDGARLKYAGYGSKQPVATNYTEEGRAKNRRVEFKILEK